MTFKKSLAASFDIDAQNCFTPICPLELPVADGHLIVDELNANARFAALRIGSKDAHPEKAIWAACEHLPQFSKIEGKHVDIRWNIHAVPGTKGFELIDGLPHPNEYDFFVWKGIEPDMHPYGACFHDLIHKQSTGVIEYLKTHHITTIIAGGLATDYCVYTTVMQLTHAGFQVILNLGACRGIAKESIETALKTMQKAGVIMIDAANDLKVLMEDEP